MSALIRRNKQQATKFRDLLVELLETRQLMASDIDASFQDLVARSSDPLRTNEPTSISTKSSSSSNGLANLSRGVQDPVAAAKVAPATYQSFGSQTLLEKSPDSLDPSQAQRIDRVAGLSKQSFEPTSYLSQFKQRVPSKSEAQAGLIGGTMVPQTNDSNSKGAATTAISAETPQAMQFVDGSALASLFRSFSVSSSSSNVKAQSVSSESSRAIQWVGGFCREDGAEIFPNLAEIDNKQTLVAEGEGDDSFVPTFEVPPLASSQYASNLNLFAPPSQSTSSTITTLGAFTPCSLTNPDYSLPGLNWALQMDQTWTSPQQWSYSETLVLSFNLENDDSDEWDSTITDGEDASSGSGSRGSGDSGGESIGGSDGTGDGNNPLKCLDGQANGLFAAGATRSGFFSFSFSASLGVSTPTSAGIAWSYSVSYSDSVSIGASAIAPFVPGTCRSSLAIHYAKSHRTLLISTIKLLRWRLH